MIQSNDKVRARYVVSASNAFTFSNLHVHMSGDWQYCVCQESVRSQLFVGTRIYNTLIQSKAKCKIHTYTNTRVDRCRSKISRLRRGIF